MFSIPKFAHPHQQREISHEAKYSATAEQVHQQRRIKRDTALTSKPKPGRVGGKKRKKKKLVLKPDISTLLPKNHPSEPGQGGTCCWQSCHQPALPGWSPCSKLPLHPEPSDLVLMLLICLMSPSQFSLCFPYTPL